MAIMPSSSHSSLGDGSNKGFLLASRPLSCHQSRSSQIYNILNILITVLPVTSTQKLLELKVFGWLVAGWLDLFYCVWFGLRDDFAGTISR